jgi:tRNA (guanosine-2'-O-)-methyltransferase
VTDRERALQAYLEGFLTPRRRERLREVLDRRTRRLAVVLDNVHQSHNFSAVLRSCEAFGVQDVHIIEVHARFEIAADIAAGTDKWLTLRRYSGPSAFRDCVAGLRENGYRIVITQPGDGGKSPREIDVAGKLALVVGNESVGVSPEMLADADGFLDIPMEGFVESFNLSVAAALCLSELTRRIRSGPDAWRLTAPEQERLLFDWTRASVPNVRHIEQRWDAEQGARNADFSR